MVAEHDSYTAKWAEELEKILGVQYYQEKVSASKQKTGGSGAGGKGAGCMVLPMCIALLIVAAALLF